MTVLQPTTPAITKDEVCLMWLGFIERSHKMAEGGEGGMDINSVLLILTPLTSRSF